jgi:hypothetical protein
LEVGEGVGEDLGAWVRGVRAEDCKLGEDLGAWRRGWEVQGAFQSLARHVRAVFTVVE